MLDLEHYKSQANGAGNNGKAKNRNASINNSILMTPNRKDQMNARDTIASTRSLKHARGLSSANSNCCLPNNFGNLQQSNIDMNDSFIFKESPEKAQPVAAGKDQSAQATQFLNVKMLEEKDEAIVELTEKYESALKDVARLQGQVKEMSKPSTKQGKSK